MEPAFEIGPRCWNLKTAPLRVFSLAVCQSFHPIQMDDSPACLFFIAFYAAISNRVATVEIKVNSRGRVDLGGAVFPPATRIACSLGRLSTASGLALAFLKPNRKQRAPKSLATSFSFSLDRFGSISRTASSIEQLHN